jgi:cytochrome P450
MSFALHEMKIILATVLQRTHLRLGAGYRPQVARRGIIWMPKGGVPVFQQQPPRPRSRG